MSWMRYAIGITALATLACYLQRNTLPGADALVADLLDAPRQRRVDTREFVANWRGKDYRVQPEYNYELTGMVVSLRQHDGNSRMHSRSQDHLNVADLCVIWGDTAVAPTLSQVSFWNGIFTCNYKTSSHEAWRAFNESEISNNHLISDDPILRDLIRDVR
ncbi:MAG: hypothetical protein AAGA84_09120, partial [Pseudomonadota bacterium]